MRALDSRDLRQVVAECLASAFLAGPWRTTAMAKRARHAVGCVQRWPLPLAQRVVAAFPSAPRDGFSELATFIGRDAAVIRACRAIGSLTVPAARGWPRVQREPATRRLDFVSIEVAMAPRAEWGLPRIDTSGDLARWLGLSMSDLAWFADLSGFARRARDPRLLHYSSRWFPKRSGGARLVEAPKRSLKEAQRRILAEIVARIPPHPAAHGFVRGRGILTHATPHAGKRVVLRLDLEDFFASIPVARVIAVLRAAGYTRVVARLLASLCTTYSAAVPPPSADVHARWRSARRYAARHLPQGAPTSPALANLCAYGLDVRLAAAAARIDATYTRYADDLVFSSNARLDRFAPLVAAIAEGEGFVVNHRKTRLMRASVRQEVTGLVVNDRPSVARAERERLEAILFNCTRRGPASQNREAHPDFRAHLQGKVAWVASIRPERATRLRELFEAIDWTA